MGSSDWHIHHLEGRTLFADLPDAIADIDFDGPLVIGDGGTYSGNWQSLDWGTPPISIQTTEPVIIENSIIVGRYDLIETNISGANVTIRNTRGYGLNSNVKGQATGRFFDGDEFKNVVIENNFLNNTAGIYLHVYEGNGTKDQTVRIIGNRAINIDGRKSDGKGGYLRYNERTRLSDGLEESGYERVQYVQFDKVKKIRHAEIAWNKVTNEPWKSRVEDNINIYRSSGTKKSPIKIHNNFIHGAYTIKPLQKSYKTDKYHYDWDYSGGGILLGDGGKIGSSFVHAYENHVISTTNYGIAIFAGHDLEFFDNRVISSGLLPDGRQIAAQNVGVYIWDGEDAGNKWFYNNRAYRNRVGWRTGSGRNDWWIPDATSFSAESWGKVSRDDETAELALFQSKREIADQQVGPD